MRNCSQLIITYIINSDVIHNHRVEITISKEFRCVTWKKLLNNISKRRDSLWIVESAVFLFYATTLRQHMHGFLAHICNIFATCEYFRNRCHIIISQNLSKIIKYSKIVKPSNSAQKVIFKPNFSINILTIILAPLLYSLCDS